VGRRAAGPDHVGEVVGHQQQGGGAHAHRARRQSRRWSADAQLAAPSHGGQSRVNCAIWDTLLRDILSLMTWA
jgi:hypothetical protein